MSRPGGVCCLVALTLVMPLAACNPFKDDPPKVDRTSGPLTDVRYQWSAGSGIELTTGPAIQFRAYLESWADAQTMGSLDYAYPGFERAVGTNSAPDERQIFTQVLRPDDGRGPVQKAAVGNRRYLVQSVDRDGLTVTATVCNYRYGLAFENENGTFSSVSSNLIHDTGIDTYLVRLTAPADQSSNNLPPQTGPAVAPENDVFGDWKITGYLSSFQSTDPGFAAAWPTYERDAATCGQDAPDPPQRREFLINGEHPRSDFPTSPPSPGWPER